MKPNTRARLRFLLPAFAFVLLTGLGAPVAWAVTFIQWTSGPGANGHYYGVTDSATSWANAEAAAVSLDGHLVSITSAEEQAFLEATFLTGGFSNLPLWIGLTDEANEGTFVWSSGEALSYTNWSSSEPNNNGGNEDYGAINWRFATQGIEAGTWNDAPLNGTGDFGGNSPGPYYGIVEVVPEPSRLLLGVLGLAAVLVRRRRL